MFLTPLMCYMTKWLEPRAVQSLHTFVDVDKVSMIRHETEFAVSEYILKVSDTVEDGVCLFLDGRPLSDLLTKGSGCWCLLIVS